MRWATSQGRAKNMARPRRRHCRFTPQLREWGQVGGRDKGSWDGPSRDGGGGEDVPRTGRRPPTTASGLVWDSHGKVVLAVGAAQVRQNSLQQVLRQAAKASAVVFAAAAVVRCIVILCLICSARFGAVFCHCLCATQHTAQPGGWAVLVAGRRVCHCRPDAGAAGAGACRAATPGRCRLLHCARTNRGLNHSCRNWRGAASASAPNSQRPASRVSNPNTIQAVESNVQGAPGRRGRGLLEAKWSGRLRAAKKGRDLVVECWQSAKSFRRPQDAISHL